MLYRSGVIRGNTIEAKVFDDKARFVAILEITDQAGEKIVRQKMATSREQAEYFINDTWDALEKSEK